MQYYPRYQPEGSKLENLIINDSVIRFDNIPENYKKLRNLAVLDLSFNNLDSIPNEFRALINLK